MATRAFGVVTESGRFVRSSEMAAFKTAESRQLKDKFSKTAYGRMGLVEPPYNPEVLANLLELNTYHYRACRTKARDTAGLGWTLTPTQDFPEEGSAEAKEMEAQRLVLEKFFSGLTPPVTSIFDRAQFDFEAVGWGAVELLPEDMDPARPYADIEHLPSHTLRIHQDGDRFAQVIGGKRRWFKIAGAKFDLDFETGVKAELGSLPAEKRASEVMYWYNYTPRSSYYGLPDIIPAIGALMGDLSRRDYNISFFDNYGVPSYAVFITGDFDPGELELDDEGNEIPGTAPLQREIEGHFRKLSANPHSTLVLALPQGSAAGKEVKVEFEKLAVDVQEASFRMYRMDNRDEILAAHGVPPYRAGIAETGSLGGSTAVESTEIYKRSIVEPRQDIIEGIINLYVVRKGFKITSWEFAFDEIDNSDELHEMMLWEAAYGMGAVTSRDVREHWADRFGVDPDGDVREEIEPDYGAFDAVLESMNRGRPDSPLRKVIQERRTPRTLAVPVEAPVG